MPEAQKIPGGRFFPAGHFIFGKTIPAPIHETTGRGFILLRYAL